MGNGNGIEGFVNFDIGYCHALMKLLYVVQIELQEKNDMQIWKHEKGDPSNL